MFVFAREYVVLISTCSFEFQSLLFKNVPATNETKISNSHSPTGWIKEHTLPIKNNKIETNNINEVKIFFDILISLSFLATNPLIYSFTLKGVLFENSNRTLSFDSRSKSSKWSSSLFSIINFCRFHVPAIKKACTNSLLQQ